MQDDKEGVSDRLGGEIAQKEQQKAQRNNLARKKIIPLYE
jgi:hypothetical protein